MGLALLLAQSLGVRAEAMTAQSYRGEVLEHREHVEAGMLILANQYPMDFNSLTNDIISDYAHFHDLPKIQSLRTLQQYQYQGHVDIAAVFAILHSKDQADFTPAENELFELTKSELNRIEDFQKRTFFARLSLKYPDEAEQMIAQLKLLELITDNVVTGLYRTRELNIRVRRYHGAHWLADKLHAAPRTIRMAMGLEDTMRGDVSAANDESCARQLRKSTSGQLRPLPLW